VVKILHAAYVDGAEKFCQLTVDLGSETRQVFAGIRSAYEPEKLVGKLTVMVANLAPRQMGFGSPFLLPPVCCFFSCTPSFYPRYPQLCWGLEAGG
jgi:hypothetical protein